MEQARQLLLDSDSNDVLAGDYKTYDFQSESSDVENSETDLLSGRQVPGHTSWPDRTNSFSNADATFKPSENVGPKNVCLLNNFTLEVTLAVINFRG